MRSRWVCSLLCAVWMARVVRQPGRTVHLRQGTLRGHLAPSATHYQYFGIPYATSHHHHRFQAAGPAPSWEGVLDAVEEHARCPQLLAPAAPLVLGAEHCLVLHVYAPLSAAVSAPLPVMVFIHGGGFKEGSGSRLLYGPDYLVARDVLLVTFNYRLGVLGFLCLGIKEAPGNIGLKDQVAALEWVRDNIAAFGGDPDNVTIFGESAGAVSVSYHLLSPMSRGLFHKAIMQSGSSVAPWARQRDPLRVAIDLARALGHNAEEPRQLYDIFMNETLYNLIATETPRKEGQFKFLHLPFVPCVEAHIEDVRPFITDTPFNILTRGDYSKVPVIIGANNEEGYFFAGFDDNESLAKTTIEASLPTDLRFPSATERQSAAERVKHVYMGEDDVSWDNILKLSKLMGDMYFNYPAQVESELLQQTSDRPVYTYSFEYSGWRNFAKLISGVKFWSAGGATHADDLFYLFSMFPLPTLFEDDMINTMTTTWTHFAKYGRLMSSLRALTAGRRLHVWRSLYSQYGARGDTTSTTVT